MCNFFLNCRGVSTRICLNPSPHALCYKYIRQRQQIQKLFDVAYPYIACVADALEPSRSFWHPFLPSACYAGCIVSQDRDIEFKYNIDIHNKEYRCMHLFRIYGNQKWPGIFMFLHFRQNQAARRHILRRLLPVGVRTNFLLGGRGDGSSVIFLLVILVSDFSPLAWLASLLRTNAIRITR